MEGQSSVLTHTKNVLLIKFYTLALMGLLTLIIGACANISGNQNTSKHLTLPSPLAIMKQMEKVANWQIPRIDSLNYLTYKRGESLEQGRWVQGAFYIGLTELAERSANPFYENWISFKVMQLDGQLGKYPYFADDQLIAQTYLWHLQNNEASKQVIAPTISAFDNIIELHQDTSLSFSGKLNKDNLDTCQRRWCWADALFMAPASWFGLSHVTGDSRYADFAHKEVQATVEFLFDENYQLLYRDSRFIEQTDDFGNQLFWSRGSGWVFAGLARTMEYIEEDSEKRKFYESLFVKMANKLKALQKQDGTWAMSLLAKENMSQPETSGTAFFTYGMAWGINQGLLPADEFLPVVANSWQALNNAVHADGKLGWVQQIGAAPGDVTYDDSQIYAVGAYLLAGSELHDYQLSSK